MQSRAIRPLLVVAGVLVGFNLIRPVMGGQFAFGHAWMGYGGNQGHTSVSPVPLAGFGQVAWTTPVDLYPSYAATSHYASPAITSANTVIVAVKTGEADGFRVEGHDGKSGTLLWTLTPDYSVALTNATSWFSVYPMGLASPNALVAAGGGGTVYVKFDANTSASPVRRYCFYQNIWNYDAAPASFANIKINTPITAGRSGWYFYGYRVEGTVPTALGGKLGGGGIVGMDMVGRKMFRRAQDLVPSNPGDDVYVSYNATPAIANDNASIYVPVTNRTQGKFYLVRLDSRNLRLLKAVRLTDPANGLDAQICSCGSASPMVAPDDQVFFGVLRNNDSSSHGWMLQFDRSLSQTNLAGKTYPVGAFGWDDTASVVPSSAVKSYTGTSPYLILTKYNNYEDTGGNGRNRLAILDPKNNSVTTDPLTGIATMNEVLTVLGVTCDSNFYPCTASTDVTSPTVPVREWCINAAAVDPVTRSAVVNSEDGHVYRWDFDTNTLKDAIPLEPAIGEPYTSTLIGPDGTAYAINHAVLHAITPLPAPKP